MTEAIPKPTLFVMYAFHAGSGYQSGHPVALQASPRKFRPHSTDVILSVPVVVPAATVTDVLRHRQSWRLYSSEEVALETLSSLLHHACQGQHDEGVQRRRAYPSAGGLYPVQVHVIAHRVEGLAAGVYRYHPEEHAFECIRRYDTEDGRWTHETHGSGPDLDRAAFYLALSGRLDEVTGKYGARGYRFALQESGHLAQNVALVATALGLASLPMGSFYDDEAARFLKVDPVEEPVLYVLAAGWPDPTLDADPLLLLRQAGGSHVLTEHWLQWRIETPQPHRLLAALEPTLAHFRVHDGLKASWHLLKSDGQVHVRLRMLAVDASAADSLVPATEAALRTLPSGLIGRWTRGVYEPEVFLFGGEQGLAASHSWFDLDSRLTVAAAGLSETQRDQVSLLWLQCTVRAVGFDAFERWDVWSKVVHLRQTDEAQYLPLVEPFLAAARRVNAAPTGAVQGALIQLVPGASRLMPDLEAWGHGFWEACRDGQIKRGARELCAVWALFHFNRMGYAQPRQAFLALLLAQAGRP